MLTTEAKLLLYRLLCLDVLIIVLLCGIFCCLEELKKMEKVQLRLCVLFSMFSMPPTAIQGLGTGGLCDTPNT